MSSLQPRTTSPSPTTEDDHDAPAPPPEFLCPITLDLMRDPVAAPTGITYDRAAIESWLLLPGGGRQQRRRTCPVTHGELRAADLVPNHTLRRLIQDWLASTTATRRCPSVVVPATPAEAAAVAELERATRAGDAERCAAAARRIRRLATMAEADDEQSRLRLASAGAAARALAAAFASFAAAATTDDVLDAVLAALVLLMPMPEDAILAVGSSPASVARLVSVADNGDLHRRLQAVVVIREIVSLSASSSHRSGSTIIDLSADAETAIARVLVKTIVGDGGGGAICSPPATRRASLVAACHLARGGERAAAALAEAGLVTALVELLVDADRCTAEKALAALDAALASSRECRARARLDALAVPVLVRKMFRVSDAATQLVVSALLRVCRRCPGDDGEEDGAAAAAAAVEALQLGAMQKVLLLLQAGCREQETKASATELLRVMVRYQGGSGECCVDAMDLRGIKRGTAILTG